MKIPTSDFQPDDHGDGRSIHPCQSNNVYYDHNQDCKHCPRQAYCLKERFQPYYINVASSQLVFADRFENSRRYGRDGRGRLVKHESIESMPVEFKGRR